ncbi:class I SAM-dependent methyltransferase family protein [Candidatus Woesearchaeota archaeon]|nr:class I SAM-dependent methyltransferase family protein [Candidatus Woesearchaeota archaeon]
MVLCVKVPLKKAQEVKGFLLERMLFHPDYAVRKTKTHIYFPVTAGSGLKRRFSFAEVTDVRSLPKARRKENMRSVVVAKLNKAELAHLRRAYDITGSIAILEIPPELERKEGLLAETILRLQKNVRTVVKKAGIHSTDYRIQPMQYLAGVDTKETVHKEHGVLLKLDVENVYFSPRLSTERKRVADQVRPGESVLVMFSGCAPYPCVIAKNTKAEEIYGIELNPFGHKYGLESLKLNKIRNVELFEGDVRELVPALKRKFDRIIMPLPKSAGDFLDIALMAAKKGTVFNFYAFEEEGKFDKAHKRIIKACDKNGFRCRILRTVKCGQHAPRVFRICVDFQIV